jgi:hypothetical protein
VVMPGLIFVIWGLLAGTIDIPAIFSYIASGGLMVCLVICVYLVLGSLYGLYQDTPRRVAWLRGRPDATRPESDGPRVELV